eukprot:m.34795 g.34795  ORF g.34795 m.34795 type:complete len:78 (+) comp32021_c1_seq1:188-421(+)
MLMNWLIVMSSGTRNLAFCSKGRYFSLLHLSTITCDGQNKGRVITGSTIKRSAAVEDYRYLVRKLASNLLHVFLSAA